MSDLTDDQILTKIDLTLAWSSEVSEMWSGTMYEKLIDSDHAQITKAVEAHDLKRAYLILCRLAETLAKAEKAYEEAAR